MNYMLGDCASQNSFFGVNELISVQERGQLSCGGFDDPSMSFAMQNASMAQMHPSSIPQSIPTHPNVHQAMHYPPNADPFSHAASPLHYFHFAGPFCTPSPEDFQQWKNSRASAMLAGHPLVIAPSILSPTVNPVSPSPVPTTSPATPPVSTMQSFAVADSLKKRKHRFLWSKNLHTTFVEAYNSLESGNIIRKDLS
jgi:hypothetical protein